MLEVKHYIAGKLVEGDGQNAQIVNPGNEETVGRLRWATSGQAQQALAAADEAFSTWSGLSLNQRGEWMERLARALEDRADEVMAALMVETGKPLDNAKYDFGMLVDCLRYFPQEAKRYSGEIQPDWDSDYYHLIIHQPLGVVVGYLAWNFPLLNLGYKIGPALAAGCTVVLKPSSYTPLASLLVGEIACDTGLPAGVLNMIAGPSRELGPVMSGSPIPKMITMIGSSEGGRDVISSSASSIKRLSLELGGNAPALVLADADIRDAAKKLVGLKFTNVGQVCVSPNRIFVHESVHDDFVEAASEYAGAIRLGWGREEGAGMGPMISTKAVERMKELVSDAAAKGARIVCGGEKPASPERGHYFLPTVLDNVTSDMRVIQEEIFGPIMPVLTFADLDAAISAANDTEYGLASYLFTRDLGSTLKVAESLQFGSVCVNEPFYSVHLPHGGIKESGVGKDCSHYSLEEYYYTKRVSIRKS